MKSPVSSGSVDSFKSVEPVSNNGSVVLCLLCRGGKSALIFGRSIFLYFNVGRKVDGFSVDDDSDMCFALLDSDGRRNFTAPMIKIESNYVQQLFRSFIFTGLL